MLWAKKYKRFRCCLCLRNKSFKMIKFIWKVSGNCIKTIHLLWVQSDTTGSGKSIKLWPQTMEWHTSQLDKIVMIKSQLLNQCPKNCLSTEQSGNVKSKIAAELKYRIFKNPHSFVSLAFETYGPMNYEGRSVLSFRSGPRRFTAHSGDKPETAFLLQSH